MRLWEIKQFVGKDKVILAKLYVIKLRFVMLCIIKCTVDFLCSLLLLE